MTQFQHKRSSKYVFVFTEISVFEQGFSPWFYVSLILALRGKDKYYEHNQE